MALVTINNYDPDYKDNILAGKDIKNYDVYAGLDDEKVGTVRDILVDDLGHLRYFVIDIGFWIFGKQVLLPIGTSRIDYTNRCVYAPTLTKEQVENLPEFDYDMVDNVDYEERVRNVYRTPDYPSTPATPATSDSRDTYNYDRDPSLYGVNEANHGSIKLYEERLMADKNRQKVGEVTVGKTVTTETARASVPVETERVVIERKDAVNTGQPVAPNEANFREGEVARMEIYEETANIRKEAFVREEVSVKKVVDRDTVTSEETLRREELDVDVEGKPVVKNDRDLKNNRDLI